MLVLSRKPGERVLIGEDVEVVVLEVDGDRVKLGFNAPRYVPICRGEIPENWPTVLPALQTPSSRNDSAKRRQQEPS